MEKCGVCNVLNVESNSFCSVCGVALAKKMQNTDEQNIVLKNENKEKELTNNANTSVIYASGNNFQAESYVKPQKTYKEKQAIASLVLSIFGLIFFFALPAQLIAFFLGVRGSRSSKNKAMAYMGIAISLAGMLLFLLLSFFIFNNYNAIIENEFFDIIYQSFSSLY